MWVWTVPIVAVSIGIVAAIAAVKFLGDVDFIRPELNHPPNMKKTI